jgi:hypothetical protein
MLDVEDVAREMRLPFSSETTNLRLDLVQSDSCFVDCAGMSFTSENGFYDVMIYLFALAYETEAADLRIFMHNEAVASNAEGIPLPDGAYLEGLPEDASVFFLDRTWLVFARHNRVVIAIEVHLHVQPNTPISQGDISTLGLVAARLAALQSLALEEVGY